MPGAVRSSKELRRMGSGSLLTSRLGTYPSALLLSIFAAHRMLNVSGSVQYPDVSDYIGARSWESGKADSRLKTSPSGQKPQPPPSRLIYNFTDLLHILSTSQHLTLLSGSASAGGNVNVSDCHSWRIFDSQEQLPNRRRFTTEKRASMTRFLKHSLLSLAVSGVMTLPSYAQSGPTLSPSTQSPAQSAPPCSDVHPILKRGIQPALPPCPDPPPAASPPADSVPTRSLSPAESLIERAREAAFEFSEKLPNFICQEFMSRFAQQGREEEMPLDVVSAEIIYEDAHESYRNVKINNRPTNKSLQEIDGALSTGEFASTLLDTF